VLAVSVQDADAGAFLQGLEGPTGDHGAEVLKEAGRGKAGSCSGALLADTRCSRSVLDSVAATDVGRLVLAEEDAQSEASEWEPRERREREEE